jgi:serine/threonine protein phosphatase PrpC
MAARNSENVESIPDATRSIP